MSYEEAETIKTIVLIILCIPPIVVLIVKDIISTIEDRKYREELKEAKILEAERRSRKLDLNENEVDMLDSLSTLNNLSRNEFLRKSIKEVINEF